MKLYHYAHEKFPQLETLHYRQVKKEGVHASADYGKHISFFFDPLDPIVLDQVYGDHHAFWKHGAQIWEHECDSHAFGDFTYYIAETPEKLELFYEYHANKITLNQYYRRLDPILKAHQYEGNQHQLDHAAAKFVGHTSRYQRDAHRYPNWEEVKNKYAACVPHVMLYPQLGFTPVRYTRQITIGQSR